MPSQLQIDGPDSGTDLSDHDCEGQTTEASESREATVEPSVPGKAVRLPLEQEQEPDMSSSSNEESDSPLIEANRSDLEDGFALDNAPDTIMANDNEGPSNERLLGTAFLSFMSFALTQLVFAFIAGSEAMMGDSAAMIVDALTYLFNWIAERKKSRFDAGYEISNDDSDPASAQRIRERARRKMVLQLEIVPPLISVSTLIIVTAFVMRKAIKVLLLDMHRKRSEQQIPNINLMLGFSVFNLGLDFLNVFCFAKAKHLLGFQTTEAHNYGEHNARHHPRITNESSNGSDIRDEARTKTSYRQVDLDSSENSYSELMAHSDIHEIRPNDTSNGNGLSNSNHTANHEEDDKEQANLNMCSAYTHVFADTLRSIAVILAAGVAELVEDVSPEEADATAAVIVSVLILLSLVPLFHGLLQSFAELRAIRAEERSETMFSQHANQVNELT